MRGKGFFGQHFPKLFGAIVLVTFLLALANAQESTGRCELKRHEKIPCANWTYGEENCLNLNCCYDRRTFPFCYYPGESNVTLPTAGTLELPESDYLLPWGPDQIFFIPENDTLGRSECDASPARIPCADTQPTRDRCIESSCCWNPGAGFPFCFHPISSSNSDDIVLECVCSATETEKTPCPAGEDLSERTCLINNCCHSPTEDESIPTCFKRMETVDACAEECRLQRHEKISCGNWTLGEDVCHGLGCCYHSSSFPFCYYPRGKDISLPTAPVTTASSDFFIPVNPTRTFFNPGIRNLVVLQCASDTNASRRPCTTDGRITREACLELSCCWNPNLDEPYCFELEPVLNSENSAVLAQILATLDEQLNGRITDNDVNSTEEASPTSRYSYENFSVVLECPPSGSDEPTESEESPSMVASCVGDNRKRCLDQACCWDGQNCFSPLSRFTSPDGYLPNGPDLPIDARRADFWIPAQVDLPVISLEEEENPFWVGCDIGEAAIPCSSSSTITRSECIALGCCWNPGVILRGKMESICSLPAVLQPDARENRRNEENIAEWNSWREWSPCTATQPCSEGGIRRRRRRCEGLISNTSFGRTRQAFLTEACTGPATETEVCQNPSQCNVASWEIWSDWEKCSDSCGPGTQSRSRRCVLSSSEGIDTGCEQLTDAVKFVPLDVENGLCNQELCNSWSGWSNASACNASCRTKGVRTEERTCLDNLAYQIIHNGSCYLKTIQCNGAPTCPPSWDNWQSWSECSESCSSGRKSRERICRNENSTIVSSDDCDGSPNDVETCNADLCNVWGEWELTGECDARCEENGTEIHTRICNNPSNVTFPTDVCNTREMSCVGELCPGEWGRWNDWSECGDVCGPSTRNRDRSCYVKGDEIDDITRCQADDPTSEPTEMELCNNNLCPDWGEWTLNDDCDASCRGNGTQTRTRPCVDQNILLKLHEQSCHSLSLFCLGAPVCPPSWDNWQSWSECSESCSTGRKSRERICRNENSTIVTSDECDGSPNEVETCNEDLCNVWGEWELTGECDARCEENGTEIHTRICNNPSNITFPSDVCNTHEMSCVGELCPGEWGRWNDWSACGDVCGPSTRNRDRSCYVKGDEIDDITRCQADDPTSEPTEIESCNDHLCPDWGEWTLNDDCDAPCRGNGTRTRTRPCIDQDILLEFHEHTCYSLSLFCLGAPVCPPSWDNWHGWSECSESCSSGRKSRERICRNENSTIVTSDECDGSPNDVETCNADLCNVWGEWELTGECDARCEENGTEIHTRICNNPSNATFPSDVCNTLEMSCVGELCPGEWGRWNDWSECGDVCGPSTRSRDRSCYVKGDEIDDITRCQADDPTSEPTEIESCNDHLCPDWGEWTLNDDCDAPCRGNGTRTRTRPCIDQDILLEFHEQSCYSLSLFCLGAPVCPPSWDNWQGWSECSESCSSGRKSRERICRNENSTIVTSDECDGSPNDVETCNADLCNVWGEWELIGECDARCEENGTAIHTRICMNPSNATFPSDVCNTLEMSCVGVLCPGEWGRWNDWSACGDVCGPSTRSRDRNCYVKGDEIDDITRCQADDPTSEPTEIELCNDHLCPDWGEWTLNDDCDAPCRGNGTQTRTRPCVDQDILLEFHEQSCHSLSLFCLGAPICPPSWDNWQSWSECSESCSSGRKSRERICRNENSTIVTSDECDGSPNEVKTCNADLCNVWGEWELTGECDARCEENGTEIHTRICNNPSNITFPSDVCNTHEMSCVGELCPGEWGRWNDWSACGDVCGPSTRNRDRSCYVKGDEIDDITRCQADDPTSEPTEIESCNDHLCPDWGEWTLNDDCDAPCRGNGTRTRTRPCIDQDILLEFHEHTCYSLSLFCLGAPVCPPSWDNWHGWSECSESCSSGRKSRERICRNENSTIVTSDECDGSPNDVETCNADLCNVWGEWELTGECDARCEENGREIHTRICNNPSNATFPTDVCNTREMSCVGELCPGEWGRWNDWSECGDVCGPSTRSRDRSCYVNSEEIDDITRCQADDPTSEPTEIELCNDHLCPDWGAWTLNDDCDAPCKGNGTQTRTRPCVDQDILLEFHEQSCHSLSLFCLGAPICPPSWDNWQSWSECSESCSSGRKSRERICRNENSTIVTSDDCGGSPNDVETCNADLCNVWGEWELTGECDARCEENGTAIHTRICMNPSNATFPSDVCNTLEMSCVGELCPVEWGRWNDWSECGDVCGPSTRSRDRNCYVKGDEIDDITRCQADDPTSEPTEIELCNDHLCPDWGEWTLNDDCDAPCRGNGTQTRTRPCVDQDILLEFHEQSCHSLSLFCLGAPICPPSWDNWQSWSECSESCSSGRKSRERICRNENSTIVSSDECDGSPNEVETCNADLCNVWGEWELTGECDARCEENGTEIHMRMCNNPSNATFPSDVCNTLEMSCVGELCPVEWGRWNDWSECGDVCGPSTRNRDRNCYVKGEEIDDITRCQTDDPTSEPTEIESCNDLFCPSWGEWTLNDDCDAPCRGNGTQTRTRPCIDQDILLEFHEQSCYSLSLFCLGAPVCPPSWDNWQGWSECSESCSSGRKLRERICRNENSTIVSSDECGGSPNDVETCNADLCNFWGEWELTGECDARCEENGTEIHTRICNNPSNITFPTDVCNTREMSCVGELCPGEWGRWNDWSECGDVCGPSTRSRDRNCYVKGDEIDDITRCQADDPTSEPTEIESCNDHLCPDWGEWTLNDDCDASCRGNGTRTRTRPCVDQDILLELHEQSCYSLSLFCLGAPVCPPSWDNWQSWSECSESCSSGKNSRERICRNENSTIVTSDECDGSPNEVETCNADLCNVWGEWELTGECDALCEENGTEIHMRMCNNPSNATFPTDVCNTLEMSCVGELCPGEWGRWNDWSECGDVCGPSTRSRDRSCYVKGEEIDDITRCQTDDPTSEPTEIESCNDHLCPDWGEWTFNDDCDAPCRGNGTQSRTRPCVDQDILLELHEQSCHSLSLFCLGAPICPPSWDNWQSWSECSESCSSGRKSRERICRNENSTIVSSDECGGSPNEVETCNADLCNVWGEWELTGECDARCEELGTYSFTRLCLDPSDLSFVTDVCNTGSENCSGELCPGDWGNWQAWSDCLEVCGPSVRSRSRSCFVKGVSSQSSRCLIGSDYEEETCNDLFCPSWGEWFSSNCTGICGVTGVYLRTRDCIIDGGLVSENDISTTFVGTPESCFLEIHNCIPECVPFWLPWRDFTECSSRCEPGNMTRTRECFFNESISHPSLCSDYNRDHEIVDDVEGALSDYDSVNTVTCNNDICLTWSPWAETSCSGECDVPGTLTRSRTCRFSLVSGEITADRTRRCSQEVVPCIGRCRTSWSLWSSWSRCSETCGAGMNIQSRICRKEGLEAEPEVCFGGTGLDPNVHRRTRPCNTQVCNAWSTWTLGDCTKECGGGGKRQKRRECVGKGLTAPITAPAKDLSCHFVIEECGNEPCDAAYLPWSAWTRCTSPCGSGTRRRRRRCISKRGGFATVADCLVIGPYQERVPCTTGCREWSTWSASGCSVTCGTGSAARTRTCAVATGNLAPNIPRSCTRLTGRCNAGPCR
ncbi:SCO-spondin-like [Clavelina lepadiformis]|uniref:SCO-spondin-like n=1 Tax=Clavelina lepadiformis TaxID=159417 RepID=UPI004042C250